MGATIGVNLFVSATRRAKAGASRARSWWPTPTHTRADLYVSLGVVASFVAALAGLVWADPLVAVLIAAIIAWQAVRILLTASTC